MWTCTKCGRVFEKEKQPHSCKKVPLEDHFKNKDLARELFDHLLEQVNAKVGKCKVISLPCCIHLFGKYDFLALLPRKDGLEISFGLYRQLKGLRIKESMPVSAKGVRNCLIVKTEAEIDRELIGWLDEAYHLKDS